MSDSGRWEASCVTYKGKGGKLVRENFRPGEAVQVADSLARALIASGGKPADVCFYPEDSPKMFLTVSWERLVSDAGTK